MPEETAQNGGAVCGSVSVIGLPNAGKSTLVNHMVGAKVSIVSHRVQTTRARVLGIALHKQAQIILIDTPGIFKPSKTLEKAMVTAALSSFEDTDYIIHIVDASHKNPIANNQTVFDAISKKKNVILVLNKVDKIDKKKLLALSQAMNEHRDYVATFMISAINGKGVDAIAHYLAQHLPRQEWIFPEDQITDMPMRLLAAEITREKIFLQLHQELPYEIFVETEQWEEFDNGSVKISQVVHVQKESQRAIVLGRRGARIKQIGQASRLELEEMMERPVHLKIFVKLQPDWAERVENYELFGLGIHGA